MPQRKTDQPKEVTLVNADGYEVSTADPTALHNLLAAGYAVKSGTAAEAAQQLSTQTGEG